MSSLTHSLVSWAEILRLPAPSGDAERYELHDGEAVLVPPARPLEKKIQKWIERLLETFADTQGVISTEFPYRPAVNPQFWIADVAYVAETHRDALPPDEHPVYSPPLIVEVLSPSNKPARVERQKIAALSGGTEQFWVSGPGKSDRGNRVDRRNAGPLGRGRD